MPLERAEHSHQPPTQPQPRDSATATTPHSASTAAKGCEHSLQQQEAASPPERSFGAGTSTGALGAGPAGH